MSGPVVIINLPNSQKPFSLKALADALAQADNETADSPSTGMVANYVYDNFTNAQADDSSKNHSGSSAWGPASQRVTSSSGSYPGYISEVNQSGCPNQGHMKESGSLLLQCELTYNYTAAGGEDLAAQISSITVTGLSGTNAKYDKLLLSVADAGGSTQAFPASSTSTSATWNLSQFSGAGINTAAVTTLKIRCKAPATGTVLEFFFTGLTSN